MNNVKKIAEEITKISRSTQIQLDVRVEDYGQSLRATLDLSEVARILEKKYHKPINKSEISQGKDNEIIFDL
jgi:hypothetical protein